MPIRKLYKEDIEVILKLKGKEDVSSHSVAKEFGVSHTTILNIWNDKYEWQKIPIDVKLAEKLIKFFSDETVMESIPESKKQEFFASLTEIERKRVSKIIGGT